MRRPEGCDVARRLDARGLCCPMPSVKTSLALESMAGGEVIEVLTDDLISKRDLPRWAEATGNELLGLVEEDSTVRIYIRKGGGL
ncbi:MAG TPA: sulfurtransferase TusA family protein [Deltaproteobacteria bacterium]|nr:sulfurtransferase TusA family protein [Deltaproteobacteria bacterium]